MNKRMFNEVVQRAGSGDIRGSIDIPLPLARRIEPVSEQVRDSVWAQVRPSVKDDLQDLKQGKGVGNVAD
jgi:hypothetical protein